LNRTQYDILRLGRPISMNSNETEIKAAEWLARLDRDDQSAADLAAFDQWKNADPRHAAAYARLAATWQALNRIQVVRPSEKEPINSDYFGVVDASSLRLEKALQQASANSFARLPSRAALPRWPSISVAAAMLLAISGFWIANIVGASHTFTTSVGGFQRIVLEDQSTLYLNTNSEVHVALSPHIRKVELVRGEASFEVAHDPSRPFIVAAGKTAVRAVGTKFDVRRLDNDVEVIVDEGKVVVGASEILETAQMAVTSTLLHVSAGQTARSTGGNVNLMPLPKDGIARKLAWQNQILIFDGDSLADVVMQFNRYNDRQLIIADPALATLRIGGYFRPTNLDAFVSVLQSDFNVRVNKQGTQLILATANH
jgi:transmembrane sensor